MHGKILAYYQHLILNVFEIIFIRIDHLEIQCFLFVKQLIQIIKPSTNPQIFFESKHINAIFSHKNEVFTVQSMAVKRLKASLCLLISSKGFFIL